MGGYRERREIISYFTNEVLNAYKAVRGVEIPKKNGKKRLLGIPTIEDKVAQMVLRNRLQPCIEPIFYEDSYGYRPNKSELDAVGTAR